MVTCLVAIVFSAHGAATAQGSVGQTEIELVSTPPAEGYYPSESESLGETGSTLVNCALNAVGVPQRCAVAQSSGFPRLDTASIALVQAQKYRARSGGSIAGVAISTRIRWELPQSPVDKTELELVRSPPAEDYYPSKSASLGETGSTVVRCTLNAAGVPQGCVIAQSSGFPRLDAASIALVRAQQYRARSGGSIGGVTILRPVRWALE